MVTLQGRNELLWLIGCPEAVRPSGERSARDARTGTSFSALQAATTTRKAEQMPRFSSLQSACGHYQSGYRSPRTTHRAAPPRVANYVSDPRLFYRSTLKTSLPPRSHSTCSSPCPVTQACSSRSQSASPRPCRFTPQGIVTMVSNADSPLPGIEFNIGDDEFNQSAAECPAKETDRARALRLGLRLVAEDATQEEWIEKEVEGDKDEPDVPALEAKDSRNLAEQWQQPDREVDSPLLQNVLRATSSPLPARFAKIAKMHDRDARSPSQPNSVGSSHSAPIAPDAWTKLMHAHKTVRKAAAVKNNKETKEVWTQMAIEKKKRDEQLIAQAKTKRGKPFDEWFKDRKQRLVEEAKAKAALEDQNAAANAGIKFLARESIKVRVSSMLKGDAAAKWATKLDNKAGVLAGKA